MEGLSCIWNGRNQDCRFRRDEYEPARAESSPARNWGRLGRTFAHHGEDSGTNGRHP